MRRHEGSGGGGKHITLNQETPDFSADILSHGLLQRERDGRVVLRIFGIATMRVQRNTGSLKSRRRRREKERKKERVWSLERTAIVGPW